MHPGRVIRFAPFEPGRNLQFRGMRWTVVSGTGRTVTLRSYLGVSQEFDLLDVIGDPGYYPHLRPDEYAPADRLYLTGLTPKDRATILEKEAIVLEVLTGYRSGRSDAPAQNEPRPEFDLTCTNLTDRYAAAARELDCGQSTVRRLCQRYRHYGLAGLYDRRAAGNRKSQWNDQPLREGLASLSRKAQDGSTVTRKVHIRRIIRVYKDKYPGKTLPSERTLYRLTDDSARKHGFAKEAKTRQSKANSAKAMHHQVVASRLGEYVMIDASPWDILLRSIHHPDKPRRYRMLVAFDLYHRGMVGFSLHAGEPQAVDAVYLLHDILNPKHMMPGWPQDMRYPYTGVPEHIVLEQYLLATDVQLTAQGFVAPSSVTIDNGAIFTSRLFQDACRRLGITVILSRPYTPTDKGVVERYFGTIERGFAAQFPGYVGRNAAHRGKELPLERLMWVDEFRDAFLRYYCTVYMLQPHTELFHPDYPKRKFSPAEMFDLGLRTGGMIRVPLDADIYYQLLPSAPRKIRPEGVEMNGLLYDHPGLDPFRQDSQRYSFSYDPRDLRYLYHRTGDGEWLRLHRKPARFPHLPFTESMLRAARADPDAGLRITPDEANVRLDVIIRDFEDVTRQRKRSRPEGTAAARLDQLQDDRERTRAPLPVDPPALPRPESQESFVPVSFSRVDFTPAADDMDLAELFDD